MGYDIQLYRREVREQEQRYPGDDFFDHEELLLPFTPAQHQALHERLLRYGYRVQQQRPDATDYILSGARQAQALLTESGLYFSAGTADFDNVFEIRMTSSEFTDTEEFAKYDPQVDGWEDFDG
jgi:hypothetical protein